MTMPNVRNYSVLYHVHRQVSGEKVHRDIWWNTRAHSPNEAALFAAKGIDQHYQPVFKELLLVLSNDNKSYQLDFVGKRFPDWQQIT